MSEIFSAIIQWLLKFRIFSKLAKIFYWEHHKRVQKIVSRKISPDKKILRGPFKGIQYASFDSAGSSLLAKILGSYEDELFEIIYNVQKTNYSEMIDVGCAEGYYAIGFARTTSIEKIYAFDTDKRARELCMNTAKLNQVNNKIILGEFCSDSTLADFKFTGRGFILSDCEGYERTLFNRSNLKNLQNCDLLIEMHNLVHPDVNEYLSDLFRPTHDIKLIDSRLKHIDYYPELKNIGLEYYKDYIISERDSKQQWIFLKAKSNL